MFFRPIHLAVDMDSRESTLTERKQPVFSWAAEHSEDGRWQTAYQIVVRNGQTIKWDSGWVEEERQSAVYQGLPLESGEKLIWTLLLRDNDGMESSLAEHSFLTALTEPWKAGWITTQ